MRYGRFKTQNCSIPPGAASGLWPSASRTAPNTSHRWPGQSGSDAATGNWAIVDVPKTQCYNGEVVAIEREAVASLSPRIVLERSTPAGMPLPQEHHFQWGQLLREPHWDMTQNYVDAVPLWPQDLRAGASSEIRTDYRVDNFSYPFWISVQTVVKRWERVSLPVGNFNALHVERLIGLQHQDFTRLRTIRWEHLWLVPEIGRWVVRQLTGEYSTSGRRSGGREDHFRWELTAWS